MPWKETDPFEEQRQLVMASEEAHESFSADWRVLVISKESKWHK